MRYRLKNSFLDTVYSPAYDSVSPLSSAKSVVCSGVAFIDAGTVPALVSVPRHGRTTVKASLIMAKATTVAELKSGLESSFLLIAAKKMLTFYHGILFFAFFCFSNHLFPLSLFLSPNTALRA